jgi:hypothetical protein
MAGMMDSCFWLPEIYAQIPRSSSHRLTKAVRFLAPVGGLIAVDHARAVDVIASRAVATDSRQEVALSAINSIERQRLQKTHSFGQLAGSP